MLLSFEGSSLKGKERAAKKIHTQFGHANAERIIKLVHNAEIEDRELIDCIKQVGFKCETCKRFEKKKSRPVPFQRI